MRMEMNLPAAWICVLAAGAFSAFFLGRSLKEQGSLRLQNAWTLLLPALLGLAFARGGFALTQFQEEYSGFGYTFRWCYTTGLLGLIVGMEASAALTGAGRWKTLDDCAAGLCLCMAMARLAQRWLGETGIGPILDNAGPYAMVNDWGEPVLAAWLVEVLLCLVAAALVLPASNRKPKTAGGTFCISVFLMMIPSILIEQFRSGAYLRYRMMRLEQAFFALAALDALWFLCRKIRKGGAGRKAWIPMALFVCLAGVIGLVQFMLDGKLIACPELLGWTLYGCAVAGMLGISLRTVRKADFAEQGKDETGK